MLLQASSFEARAHLTAKVGHGYAGSPTGLYPGMAGTDRNEPRRHTTAALSDQLALDYLSVPYVPGLLGQKGLRIKELVDACMQAKLKRKPSEENQTGWMTHGLLRNRGFTCTGFMPDPCRVRFLQLSCISRRLLVWLRIYLGWLKLPCDLISHMGWPWGTRSHLMAYQFGNPVMRVWREEVDGMVTIRHDVNNKAGRREVEAVKGCRRQPEAMGEWMGRREDTTTALGGVHSLSLTMRRTSLISSSSEEESVTSRLIFLLGRQLGGGAPHVNKCGETCDEVVLVVGDHARTTPQDRFIGHYVDSSWKAYTVVQGEVEETKCTTVYRLPHFGHAGTGGGEEHSGSGQRTCRTSIFIVSRSVERDILKQDSELRYRKKGGRGELEGGHTCLAQASPRPSAGSSFKLREEAVGRWQCSSRYGKGVEAEFIEWSGSQRAVATKK
ncbi:hypothetical protein DFH08DRAFT_1028519 [Mycena albidolilacea]|uniref:Uncharacterized protein n=1 Tax=Mycena albidolilacea TaxID=1033008 RepID=A0AAD6ZK57_9AGAR|nr:hypothetical protein DFH08DRAFT_1028519 [Mycena albidolilacea]